MSDRHEPVRVSGLEVRPRDGESPERLVRRFRNLVRDDGVLWECRQRRSYEKPSVRRRKKHARAVSLAGKETRE